MSKFMQIFSRIITTTLVIAMILSSVYAQNKTQTSNNALVELSSISNAETISGELILVENKETTNSGSLLKEKFNNTGGIIFNKQSLQNDLTTQHKSIQEQKRLEQSSFKIKTNQLSDKHKEELFQKIKKIRLAIEQNNEIQTKIQNYKTQKKTLQINPKIQKESLETINATLKTVWDQKFKENLTHEEQGLVIIEPNYLFEIQEDLITTGSVIPNDTKYENQWGLSSIINDQFLISNETATSSYSPLIAMIDTGVDYNHEDLQGQFWTDETCVDDLNEPIENGCLKGGYDFVDEDTDPYASDSYVHGTAVAGILGAKTNNNLGIASLSNNQIQIMSLRVADDGILELEKIIQAIYFAINNGADIINMSFGGPTYSDNLKIALEYAQSQGVIVVAAAGNYANNNDITPIYPASYDLSNIISVAAHDQNDNLANFSDYGVNSVDIAAPGVDILTTGLNNSYVNVSGTSFSTPFVVGAYVYYVNVVKNFIEEII